MQSLEMVSIRRARPGDQVALASIEEEGVTRSLDWQQLLSQGSFFTYLAEDSEPFGYVSAGPAIMQEDHTIGEIVALLLKSEYRGFGMGRKLLVRGLSVLKRREFSIAQIWIPDHAAVARDVVRSLDFEADGSERIVNEMSETSRRETSRRETSRRETSRRETSRRETSYCLSLEDYF